MGCRAYLQITRFELALQGGCDTQLDIVRRAMSKLFVNCMLHSLEGGQGRGPCWFGNMRYLREVAMKEVEVASLITLSVSE